MKARKRTAAVLAIAAILLSVSCGQPDTEPSPIGTIPPASLPAPAPGPGIVPRPDHVVVVVLENHGPEQVLGSGSAPYLDQLAATGALFTNATAITHPSQPNYLALFSGDTQGVTDDSCPHIFTTPNLGEQLLTSAHGFVGYAEDLPGVGYSGCGFGGYARKHSPWVDFSTVPADATRPLTEFGPNYSTLPAVSFVIPNLCHDMHDCDVATGDAWLRDNLDGFVQWSATHNSLLVVTFDEAEDSSPTNQIPLILVGPMVRPGVYSEPVNHYRLLRTIEAMYGLPPLGHAADTPPLLDVWHS
ncbi:alkaline phosphatase family protein [Amycolatopsis taiwanensis]|uniref:Acid phosphatase n=1 Tax=Amycolatopsis taiwanensis TaxID=342230 RepID=A0A9W6VH02_9PSEU|nr:alkaline phosphatase family protein [Amycolatopsis taiwanensis]GLY66534.1 acid phosphatase [Amycolatopsis taiwanensis]